MEIAEFNKNNRINFLDTLRGISIIYVVLYHFLYDIILFGVDVPFFGSFFMEAVHNFFLVILITVSGICTAFSRNIFKRGAFIYILGGIITFATSVFMPENIVVFGVLSFFGISMLAYGTIKPFLDKIPWLWQFFIWVFLSAVFWSFDENGIINLFLIKFKLPDFLYEIKYLYPLGIKSDDFYSADYFSLIPWFFVFLCGTALSKPVLEKKAPELFYKISFKPIDFLGRNSLTVYIIHQPVIYGIVWLIFNVI
jgi:uncharacterized membrane protein